MKKILYSLIALTLLSVYVPVWAMEGGDAAPNTEINSDSLSTEQQPKPDSVGALNENDDDDGSSSSSKKKKSSDETIDPEDGSQGTGEQKEPVNSNGTPVNSPNNTKSNPLATTVSDITEPEGLNNSEETKADEESATRGLDFEASFDPDDNKVTLTDNRSFGTKVFDFFRGRTKGKKLDALDRAQKRLRNGTAGVEDINKPSAQSFLDTARQQVENGITASVRSGQEIEFNDTRSMGTKAYDAITGQTGLKQMSALDTAFSSSKGGDKFFLRGEMGNRYYNTPDLRRKSLLQDKAKSLNLRTYFEK